MNTPPESTDLESTDLESTDLESIASFQARAREFARSGALRPAGEVPEPSLRAGQSDEEELAAVAREREVQRLLFDAGLAGVCVPRAYGGQGLTPAHQQVLNTELAGLEYPSRFQVPTMTPCLAVLLDFGTEEQKQRLVPPILRGEALWMQFLSEPSGGSDVAGALTTAVRDGEEWILNGSKVWTTGAWWSDWGMCLARTNWDVPKHRGLTVFVFPIEGEGMEVQRIEMLNGSQEFCQEFLTDFRVPDANRIGEVDDGWTVGSRWMFHERMQHNSPLVTMPEGHRRQADGESLIPLARTGGRLDDRRGRELVGEHRMLNLVGGALNRRIAQGVATGTMSEQSSAIGRLFSGRSHVRMFSIAFELAGTAGAAWTDDDEDIEGVGDMFLMRQVSSIGGGTTEMAANVVAERVLGMPREPTKDRDVAFRDVPRSAPQG